MRLRLRYSILGETALGTEGEEVANVVFSKQLARDILITASVVASSRIDFTRSAWRDGTSGCWQLRFLEASGLICSDSRLCGSVTFVTALEMLVCVLCCWCGCGKIEVLKEEEVRYGSYIKLNNTHSDNKLLFAYLLFGHSHEV